MYKHILPAVFVGLSLATASFAQAPIQVRSQGTFTDKGATVHSWYVNAAHTLIWDNQPFVPVGGLFQAKSWTATATDADYESDVAALKLLKEHGVTDVYLQAARGGITSVKAENIQRLVDYLDSEGFTYGISLNDGPREPLIGYVVRPGAFRQAVPTDAKEAKFTVPDTASALYFTVNAAGGEVREEGEAEQNGDTLRVAVSPGLDTGVVGDDVAKQMVVLLVPERIFAPGTNAGTELGMRNLWEGFDSYRDSLIMLFGNVKFGKGFRFMGDPLPTETALTDSFQQFIPTSDAFRAEWSAFLSKKYGSMNNLQLAWGVMDRQIASFDEGAKLVPLWQGGKGIAEYYDPATKERLRANSVNSTFWADLATFKAESVRGYMNDLAVALKRTVADVPIVYRNGAGAGWNELFASVSSSRGFDGFGVVAYGRGAELAQRSAAYTLAQAAESPKTIWLPVLGTAPTPLSVATGAETYDAKVTLTGSFDWLREAGAKGFYVSGVRIADPARAKFDLSATPEKLDWLRDYATILDSSGMRTRTESVGASQAPPAVFYPYRNLPELSPTTLTNGGGWWLPTSHSGQFYNFGKTAYAYSIEEPGVGLVYYIWNPKETRRITIRVPKTALDTKNGNRVGWSENAQGELKKENLTLTVGPEPIRLRNYPVIPVPMEAFPDVQLEAAALIKEAKEAKSDHANRYAQDFAGIRYNKEDPYTGLTEALKYVGQMRFERRKYLWIDAEFTGAHSFDEISEKPGASSNRVLEVDPRLDNSPALAQYKINLGDDRPRDVWVAMSPDALVSVRLDGHPLVDDATIPQKIGNLYANGSLVWVRFGTATIPKGTHVLEVRADGPALIDAILLTPTPFTPDGPNPPPVLP